MNLRGTWKGTKATRWNWVKQIFDHPVTDPAWYWELDAESWSDRVSAKRIATLIAETFERSGKLLARFSDAQLNQGFKHLIMNISAEYIYAIDDPEVPMELRLRALRSFVPVFEQVMAVRCSLHLSHLDEKGGNPLNSACYMWWDILAIHGKPELPERQRFDAEILVILERLLAIPHDACRESALHGIGEWFCYYPEVSRIVDDFLERTPNLRPELIEYALRAREGDVL